MGGQVRAGQQHGQRAQGRTGRETPRHRAFGRQHGGAQPPGQRHNRQPQHAQAGAARQSRRPSAGTGARGRRHGTDPGRPGPRPPPWTASRSRLHLLAADVALGKAEASQSAGGLDGAPDVAVVDQLGRRAPDPASPGSPGRPRSACRAAAAPVPRYSSGRDRAGSRCGARPSRHGGSRRWPGSARGPRAAASTLLRAGRPCGV